MTIYSEPDVPEVAGRERAGPQGRANAVRSTHNRNRGQEGYDKVLVAIDDSETSSRAHEPAGAMAAHPFVR